MAWCDNDYYFANRVEVHTSRALHEEPMHPIRLLSAAEQVAARLRQELNEGGWSGRLPGVRRLAAGYDVSTGVARAALRQLEAEGLLGGRGKGTRPHGGHGTSK